MKGISRFPAPLLSILLAVTFSCASAPPLVNTSTNLSEGATLELEGNYAAAMEAYREHLYSLPDDADHVPTYLKLARCAMKIPDYRQAREYFKLASSSSDSTEVRFEAAKNIGDAYYRENRFVLATSYFADAERYEKNPLVLDEIYYKLAVCYQQTRNETAARDYYGRVHKYHAAPGEPSFEPWSPTTRDGGEGPSSPSHAAGVRVIDRESWHPRPMRRNYDPMGAVYRLTVHHSAISETDRDFDASARAIKSIQSTHMGSENNWADIGYHFLIDRAGRIWEGRPIYIQGAHAGNPEANKGNVGVCLLGDYGEQEPSFEQKEALRELIVNLIAVHGISTDRLYTHREIRSTYGLTATECPGNRLQKYVDSLRADLRRYGSSARTVARNQMVFHQVHQGETLFQISKQYGVTVADLKRANTLSDTGDIEVGQRIRIPR